MSNPPERPLECPPPHAIAAADRALDHWRAGTAPDCGWVVPYRHAGDLVRDAAPAWLHTHLADALPRMERWLDAAREYAADLEGEGGPDQVTGARFDQDWFTGLDATLAYTLIRAVRPRRVVEVGSGHSTRFIARAIHDAGANTHLLSIDPQPRREIDALCSEVDRRPLSVDSAQRLTELDGGDVLFIDGSHIFMAGTDVDLFASHVLPALPTGCLVHLHDLFLPDDYPVEWHWRGYNEQSLVSALIGTGRLQVEAAAHWLATRHPGRLEGVHAPCCPTGYQSSIWFRVA